MTNITIIPTKSFRKSVKKLYKKYPSIISDLDLLIQQLQSNTIIGDRLQGYDLPIYKARISNSSINVGKSGGFRVIYHIKVGSTIYLLAIYSKTMQGDISKKAILEILSEIT